MRTLLLVVSMCLLIAGCNPKPNQQAKTQSAAEDPMCKPTPIRYFDSEQKAKAITEQVKGIDKVVAVRIDDELDVAIQVSNFNRFRLKSIEKEVAQKLKSSFPNAKIHVTSDKKLIMELQKLSDTPWSNKQEEACKHKKTLKKIEEDMKG
ncbi:YhcN/YlaJ family sporulation lipoprotein [Brevibacillus choshinensis]|uniref:Sporulation protein n=1 Tax=Brevibacillus choshinensis TaxID=54911 RepID=A0ABX7FSS4_BRECH|nr:YhcN/YlaJ family sporulation lipoprotein [Brevibacillus choshinensis]QRG68302.1 sporulation protein [Brevibacillus choshinensis]